MNAAMRKRVLIIAAGLVLVGGLIAYFVLSPTEYKPDGTATHGSEAQETVGSDSAGESSPAVPQAGKPSAVVPPVETEEEERAVLANAARTISEKLTIGETLGGDSVLMDFYGLAKSAATGSDDPGAAHQKAIERIVAREAAYWHGKNLGFVVTDDEVAADIDDWISSFNKPGSGNRDKIADGLATAGLTFEDYMKSARFQRGRDLAIEKYTIYEKKRYMEENSLDMPPIGNDQEWLAYLQRANDEALDAYKRTEEYRQLYDALVKMSDFVMKSDNVPEDVKAGNLPPEFYVKFPK
jgi:hypothetical protein